MPPSRSGWQRPDRQWCRDRRPGLPPPSRSSAHPLQDLPGSSDVKVALTDAAIAQRLAASGQTVVPGSAAGFAASIEKQRASIAGFAGALGIKPATIE